MDPDAQRTEAGLVTAIDADPDDDAAFLVYADWLIERADPRGELIALQRDPAHHTVSAQLLDAYRAALLGSLAESEVRSIDRLGDWRDTHVFASHVELVWQRGFVRDARVIAIDPAAAVKCLDNVIESPACRFLRRLEVYIVTFSGLDRGSVTGTSAHPDGYRAIEARLVERGRPVTLEAVVLGDPGEHQPSDAMHAAFPRLRRTSTWGAIAAAIATLDVPQLDVDAGLLTQVTTRDGVELDRTTLLHGLVAELGRRRRPLGLLDMLGATCETAMLDRYAASLVEHAFDSAHERPAVHDAIVTLGGPRTAHALGRRLAREPAQHHLAPAITECLNRMATPLATLELAASMRRGPLDLIMTYEADRIARAGSDPMADLDPELAERFAAIDLRILEHLLVCGWRTRLGEAIELFVRAPRAVRAKGLVWGRSRVTRSPVLRRPRVATEPFFLDHTGAHGADGRLLELSPDEPIWLVHPAELDQATLATWRDLQRARTPAIQQLDRALPLLSHPRPTIASLETLLDPFPSRDALLALGFSDTRRSAFLQLHCYHNRIHGIITINLVHRRLFASDELPAVVLHELARDLLAISRR